MEVCHFLFLAFFSRCSWSLGWLLPIWRLFMALFLGFVDRAREEGLRFGFEELKQQFCIKGKNGFPGTMILAPRPGRSVLDGIPNRDDRWREKFFVFKINPASVGDFDFGTIPRVWSNEIEPFGSAPMTPELRGLIATLRRGNPRWLVFTVDRIKAAYALPSGENRATPIGSVVHVRPRRGCRDKRAREKEALPNRPDESSEVGSLQRAQKTRHGEGTSQVDPSARIPDAQETFSWIFSYDDEVPILKYPERLALIWRKIREKGCELPPLDDMRERDAYVQMAVTNDKAMEASNEYAALMEKRSADIPCKEEVGGHLLMIQQLRGELEIVRVIEKQREVEVEGLKGKLFATEAEKDKLRKKKEETAAEIRLQEVQARIEALTEYIEDGFKLEEELVRLKDRENSLDLDYGIASVSDSFLSSPIFLSSASSGHIDVPQSTDHYMEPAQHGVQDVLNISTEVHVFHCARLDVDHARLEVDHARLYLDHARLDKDHARLDLDHDRLDLDHEVSQNDRDFSLLARLARTACTDGRADDFSTLFDP
ncbi:unnamed protein product [Brassica rapa]|uniref:Uncharacterized protein n=1 Tax=Brassica campestris TaxID=3711 RepID=A0A3P5Y1E1_BRACM|nr:unnamed protein product [Brassica rapa]VDC60996.1 unnamed protein product [Brassica rapa]